METLSLDRLGKALMRIRRVNISLNCQDITVAELQAMILMVDNQQEATENVFATEMAQQLNLSKASLSQMMNSLENRGFIQRTLNRENRRKIILTLTSKGRQAVKNAREAFLSLLQNLVQGLGEEKAAQLTELLEECSELLVAGEQRP